MGADIVREPGAFECNDDRRHLHFPLFHVHSWRSDERGLASKPTDENHHSIPGHASAGKLASCHKSYLPLAS